MGKNNKKKTKKIIIISSVVVLVLAGILIGIRIVNKNKEADVYPVSMLADTYWTDESEYAGSVTSGRIQKVKLKNALVESVNVNVGDTVKKGDILMVYDSTEYLLSLQQEKAEIAVLEAQIAQCKRDIEVYQKLKPLEEYPSPTEEIIDHGPLDIKEFLKESECKETDVEYMVSLSTVIEPGFLKKLREKELMATLYLYEDETYFGQFVIDGLTIPETVDKYEEVKDNSGGEPVYRKVQKDPIEEAWVLSNIIEFDGSESTFYTDSGYQYYGAGYFFEPKKYERYEVIIHYPQIDPESEDYTYTRAELAQMIKEKTQEIAETEINLNLAMISLFRSMNTSESGRVLANIDGVVTEVKNPSECSEGDAVITVKGSENFSITLYMGELDFGKVKLGDKLNITGYESGTSTTATITEIGITPNDSYLSYGGNPNNSYYPVTAVVDESDVEMSIGESCKISQEVSSQSGESLYIPMMYVRNDAKGYYVMKEEKGKLKKQYVTTGQNLYGYEIEIKEGLTMEDSIAFPYGSGENEGTYVKLSEEYAN